MREVHVLYMISKYVCNELFDEFHRIRKFGCRYSTLSGKAPELGHLQSNHQPGYASTVTMEIRMEIPTIRVTNEQDAKDNHTVKASILCLYWLVAQRPHDCRSTSAPRRRGTGCP